jgi:PD-(D/E)XK nuclease superfamily protein
MTIKVQYVSTSEMEDFLRCQWRWYAKWRLNRVPRAWSTALILGTAVHDIFERHFALGTSLDVAHLEEQKRLLDIAHTEPDPDKAVAYARANQELIKYRDQIVDFRDKYPIDETLEVEEAFELSLLTDFRSPQPVEWVLRGRPDRPVRIGDVVYHMQHKTVAISKPVHVYTQYLSRSMHEGLYGYHLSKKYSERGLRYGGSIVNLIRKGTATAKHPLETLGFQTMIRVDEVDRQRAYMRATAIASEMADSQRFAAHAGINALVDNPLEDDGFYGNTLDGYLPALTGKAKLDDDHYFMDREETYV